MVFNGSDAEPGLASFPCTETWYSIAEICCPKVSNSAIAAMSLMMTFLRFLFFTADKLVDP